MGAFSFNLYWVFFSYNKEYKIFLLDGFHRGNNSCKKSFPVSPSFNMAIKAEMGIEPGTATQRSTALLPLFTCGLVILVDLPDISTMLSAFLAVSLALNGLTLTATYSRGYKNRATV